MGGNPRRAHELKEGPRPRPYDVGPFWTVLYAVHTYTSAADSEPWMRLDAAEEFQERTALIAAPVLRVVGDADLYCVDAEGSIVQHRHEEGALEPVGLGYWGLLDRELGALRERKERRIRERL